MSTGSRPASNQVAPEDAPTGASDVTPAEASTSALAVEGVRAETPISPPTGGNAMDPFTMDSLETEGTFLPGKHLKWVLTGQTFCFHLDGHSLADVESMRYHVGLNTLQIHFSSMHHTMACQEGHRALSGGTKDRLDVFHTHLRKHMNPLPPPLDRCVHIHLGLSDSVGHPAPSWTFGKAKVESKAEADKAAAGKADAARLHGDGPVLIQARTMEEVHLAITALALGESDVNTVACTFSLFGLGFSYYIMRASKRDPRGFEAVPAAVGAATLEQVLSGFLWPREYSVFAASFVAHLCKQYGRDRFIAFCRRHVTTRGGMGRDGPSELLPLRHLMEQLDRACQAEFGTSLEDVESSWREAITATSDDVVTVEAGLQASLAGRSAKFEDVGGGGGKDPDDPSASQKRRRKKRKDKDKASSSGTPAFEAQSKPLDPELWPMGPLQPYKAKGRDDIVLTAKTVLHWTVVWLWANERGSFLWCIVFILYQACFSIVQPIALRLIFDTYIPENQTGNIGIAVAVIIVGHLLFAQTTFLLRDRSPTGKGFIPVMGESMARHICSARQIYLDNANHAHLLATMDSAIPALDKNIDGFLGLIETVIQLLALVGTLIFLSPLLSACVVLTFPLYIWFHRAKGHRIEQATDNLATRSKLFFAAVEENVRRTVTRRLLGLWEAMNEKMGSEKDQLREAWHSFYHATAQNLRGIKVLELITSVVVIGVGSFLVNEYSSREATGQNPSYFFSMSLGEFIGFYIAATPISKILGDLMTQLRTFDTAKVALSRLIPMVKQQEDPFDQIAKSMPTTADVDIEVREIAFTFNTSAGDTVPVLKDVSVRVPAGKKVGVVGRSGSGKSTLMKLMTRLYTPARGDITVAGMSIYDMDMPALVSSLEQEPSLFDMTVAENVRIGTEASSEEIVTAARLACVYDDIMALPAGFNAPCGYNGLRFSGGQRQRIGLARTIVRNRPIVMLDEPVSAQEPQAVTAIGRTLARLQYVDGQGNSKPSTVMAISHSLSFIQDWDLVMVISDGMAPEYSTHEDLLAFKGKYYMMHQAVSGLIVDASGHASVSPERLERIWFLSSCSGEHLKTISGLTMTRSCSEGETIYREGDECDSLYMLVSGAVEEYKKDADGNDVKTTVWQEGEVTGERSLIRGLGSQGTSPVWDVTAVATTKGTVVIKLPYLAFKAALGSSRELEEAVHERVRMVEMAKAPEKVQLIWPFVGLAAEDLKAVSDRMELEVLDQGATAFSHPNDPARSLYILVEGAVALKVESMSYTGEKTSWVQNIESVCTFGERAVAYEGLSELRRARATTRCLMHVLRDLNWLKIESPEGYATVKKVVKLEQQLRLPEVLLQNWMLSAAPLSTLAIVGGLFGVASYPEGQVILDESMDNDTMIVVLAGQVTIAYRRLDGSIHHVSAGPGAFINEVSLVGDPALLGEGIVKAEVSRVAVLLTVSRETVSHALGARYDDLTRGMLTLAKKRAYFRRSGGMISLGLQFLSEPQRAILANGARAVRLLPGEKLLDEAVPSDDQPQHIYVLLKGDMNVDTQSGRKMRVHEGNFFWSGTSDDVMKSAAAVLEGRVVDDTAAAAAVQGAASAGGGGGGDDHDPASNSGAGFGSLAVNESYEGYAGAGGRGGGRSGVGGGGGQRGARRGAGSHKVLAPPSLGPLGPVRSPRTWGGAGPVVEAAGAPPPPLAIDGGGNSATPRGAAAGGDSADVRLGRQNMFKTSVVQGMPDKEAAVVLVIDLGSLSATGDLERRKGEGALAVETDRRNKLKKTVQDLTAQVAKLEVRLGLRLRFNPKATWKKAFTRVSVYRIMGIIHTNKRMRMRKESAGKLEDEVLMLRKRISSLEKQCKERQRQLRQLLSRWRKVGFRRPGLVTLAQKLLERAAGKRHSVADQKWEDEEEDEEEDGFYDLSLARLRLIEDQLLNLFKTREDKLHRRVRLAEDLWDVCKVREEYRTMIRSQCTLAEPETFALLDKEIRERQRELEAPYRRLQAEVKELWEELRIPPRQRINLGSDKGEVDIKVYRAVEGERVRLLHVREVAKPLLDGSQKTFIDDRVNELREQLGLELYTDTMLEAMSVEQCYSEVADMENRLHVRIERKGEMKAEVKRLAPQMGMAADELLEKLEGGGEGEGEGGEEPTPRGRGKGGELPTPRTLVSDDAIAAMERQAKEMQATVNARIVEREQLVSTLTMAWDELGVAEKQRRNFLAQHEGITEEVLVLMREEMERVNDRREREREGRKIQLYDEIQDLWEKLRVSDEEVDQFVRSVPCVSEGTLATDVDVVSMQRKLKELKERLRQRRLLSLFGEVNVIWDRLKVPQAERDAVLSALGLEAEDALSQITEALAKCRQQEKRLEKKQADCLRRAKAAYDSMGMSFDEWTRFRSGHQHVHSEALHELERQTEYAEETAELHALKAELKQLRKDQKVVRKSSLPKKDKREKIKGIKKELKACKEKMEELSTTSEAAKKDLASTLIQSHIRGYFSRKQMSEKAERKATPRASVPE